MVSFEPLLLYFINILCPVSDCFRINDIVEEVGTGEIFNAEVGETGNEAYKLMFSRVMEMENSSCFLDQ